ncbi:hypothetical protein B0T22DRAFT_41691 [Podospora appendiculata]|uniref:Uncharacterized protein n=1 Tax=Podospora appendiculata TaxID=314037 RepID=A0AAE1CGJ2_9PEZI|nr:hypothetical protein B0T22DRAFT_41691 [Podospora appendiculata]
MTQPSVEMDMIRREDNVWAAWLQRRSTWRAAVVTCTLLGSLGHPGYTAERLFLGGPGRSFRSFAIRLAPAGARLFGRIHRRCQALRSVVRLNGVPNWRDDILKGGGRGRNAALKQHDLEHTTSSITTTVFGRWLLSFMAGSLDDVLLSRTGSGGGGKGGWEKGLHAPNRRRSEKPAPDLNFGRHAWTGSTERPKDAAKVRESDL